jgi:hypothetical protein
LDEITQPRRDNGKITQPLLDNGEKLLNPFTTAELLNPRKKITQPLVAASKYRARFCHAKSWQLCKDGVLYSALTSDEEQC